MEKLNESERFANLLRFFFPVTFFGEPTLSLDNWRMLQKYDENLLSILHSIWKHLASAAFHEMEKGYVNLDS